MQYLNNLTGMPIKDKNGECQGVAQVINKKNGPVFTKKDEVVFTNYLQFCGIGLRNAQLYEQSKLENKRNQVILLAFINNTLIDYSTLSTRAIACRVNNYMLLDLQSLMDVVMIQGWGVYICCPKVEYLSSTFHNLFKNCH